MSQLTLEQVIASPRLPSLPAVAVQIIELVQQEDVGLPDLAATIGRDAALTGKILKTANSSYYARARAVSKLSDALMVLGLRRVKTLALGFSLVDGMRKEKGSGFDHTGFWQRSLMVATAARGIAALTARADQEEAFLAGLTHSLGVVALNQAMGEEYQELFRKAEGSYWRLVDVERERLGFSHADLGGALGEKWNLPPQLVAALRYYTSPELAPAEYRQLVSCITTGALAADVLTSKTPAEPLNAYRTACDRWFDLTAEESDELIRRIIDEARPMQALLNLPASRLSPGEILAQANEALEIISFEAEDQNQKLEQERAQLTAQATTDGLTGLSNRRHFDDFLARAVAEALQTNTPLSLLMLDLDHFKRLNDTYGHPGGDVVLKAVGRTLRESVRLTDIAARYGGEEFAVVMPGTGASGAFGLARRMRAAIEALELDLGEQGLVHVTASLGVAGIDHQRHRQPEDLIRDADAALYEAKESGRNTVRLARRKEQPAA